MPSRIPAVLWAQWRILWNLRLARGSGGRLVGLALVVVWYGLWTALAASTAVVLADPARREAMGAALPWALLLVFGYWQLTPVFTASLGASLNLTKVLIYPIPERQLFALEVLLRVTTGVEMLLVLGGITLGLLLNPAVPGATVLVAVTVFALLNLLLAAGTRSLLERLVAHKRMREALVFLLVLAVALPQVLAHTGLPRFFASWLAHSPAGLWPWTAAGRVALGASTAADWAVLGAWTLAAYLFGRWQFSRTLRVDAAAAGSAPRPVPRAGAWTDRLYRLPVRLLPDPLAALVEKELRSLFRTPRFRLVFLMGFTFGFLIWVPLWRTESFIFRRAAEDFAVLVSVYALLLLSEVVFWNVFGFDRAAAQLNYSAPARLRTVLAAKNLAAAVVVVLEATMITAACLLLRMPVTAGKILEAYAVLLILSLFLTAAGNLSSLYWARPVDPDHSWGRTSRGRSHALMVLVFPLLSLPVLLAYVARHVFQSQLVFLGGLAVATALGALCYRLALGAAAGLAERQREDLLAVLTAGAGPLA